MKKKILITGVNGFLGGAMYSYLKRKRVGTLYGVDKKVKNSAKNIYQCDLNSSRKIKTVLNEVKPDIIFHLAGGRMQDESQLYTTNYLSTKSLLDALSDKSTRVVIPGTAAEYGKVPRGKLKFKETDPARPVTYYGRVKLQQTKLVLKYAAKGYNVIVARIFNIMGSGTPPQLAIGRFATQIVDIERKKKGVINTKNLSSKRDFLDVMDVCAALDILSKKGRSGQIYNVCSAKAVTIRELLDNLLKASKIKDIKILEGKSQSSKSFDAIGSNSKLKRLARWKPKVSIKQSLANTLISYRKYK